MVFFKNVYTCGLCNDLWFNANLIYLGESLWIYTRYTQNLLYCRAVTYLTAFYYMNWDTNDFCLKKEHKHLLLV